MSSLKNGFGTPALMPVAGRFVCVEPLDLERDADGLFASIGGAANADLWRYVPLGPFDRVESMVAAFRAGQAQGGWQTNIIRDGSTGHALGTASYMRIRPEAGSAEIGCVIYGPALKRTPAATEAMYILARHIFDELGYRRYEWKCNNRNEASKRAAERLGFQFEGVFRQDMIVKGENRDTAWYSIIDSEWPAVKAAFEAWLAPENFDAAGQQIKSLGSLRV
ncbi:MAG: GNAT family N-acetyltransferase [Alphaproteobacteria bacterium]